ncbi:MAG: 16S rRNA (guanine(527)-N(7))-methyltransferase RsmG [Alphaproteobacteria bacterium]|nr:16S rRNA (guanine(527)-N(7))-methyltransferase RsmG [Alphaproteobacteria bacterium]
MDITQELQKYDVSRETIEKLRVFVSLLQEWNTKMNLVSKNSLTEVWLRHILDSLQLIQYIPANTELLLDIGSGAGFPAVVLAIVMQEKMPNAKWILVESITKKTVYLNDVSAKLGLKNVQIENIRVENLKLRNINVVTARAVAALDVLCGYASSMSGKNTKCLFLKGKTYQEELQKAREKWLFDCITHQNIYSDDGVLLEISNLRKRK